MSLQSAETNGQYLPTQMYNAAWIPSLNVFDFKLSPAPLLMLQLFYCTLNETLPLTGESNGGQQVTVTPIQENISLVVGCAWACVVRVRACVRVCAGGVPGRRRLREGGGRRTLRVREKGTASTMWVSLQSHQWQRVLLNEQSFSVFQLKASKREMRALPWSCYCHVLEQENTTGNKTTDIRHVKNK